MINLAKFIVVLFVIVVVGCESAPAQFDKHTLWRDEFSGTGTPDTNIWTKSVTKPNEKQLSAYCDNDSNAYLKNGKLHLRLYKTDNAAVPYKSGRVIVKKAFNFKKGRLVVRAKAPVSAGTWSAIWLNGPKTKDGYFAELDLMEYVRAMGVGRYNTNYHLWGSFRGKDKNHTQYPKKVPVNVGKWHVYTLEVTDDKIVMKVDGKIMYTISKGDYGEEWPTDQEYSLRLALAYGGYAAKETGIDDSALPAEMLVDYVRFYPLKK